MAYLNDTEDEDAAVPLDPSILHFSPKDAVDTPVLPEAEDATSPDADIEESKDEDGAPVLDDQMPAYDGPVTAQVFRKQEVFLPQHSIVIEKEKYTRLVNHCASLQRFN